MSHRNQSLVTLYHGVAGPAAKTARSKGLKPPEGEGLLLCESPAEAKRLALAMVAYLANEGIVAVAEIAVFAATVKRSRLDPEPALPGAYWLRGSVRPSNLKVLQMVETSEELPADFASIEEIAARFEREREEWRGTGGVDA